MRDMTLDEAIAAAFREVRGEVRRQTLSNLVRVERTESHVRIFLEAEDRDVWIGYSPGKGYFMVAQAGDPPGAFFDLTPETVLSFLPLESRPSQLDIEQQAVDAAALLSSVTSSSPDVGQLKELIERVPATDEGLDVLSTVAALGARRRSISRLRELIADDAAPERAYQDLIAKEQWMLGAQYQGVVGKERVLWFGARIDLLLQSVLGYVDVVEFKRPKMTLLVRGWRAGSWKQSAELSEVYSQAQAYIRLIDENRSAIETELGLNDGAVSRMYRSSVIVVAGRQPEDKRARDMIRELNGARTRIILMTYDEVLSIGEATLALFERRLARHGAMLGA